MWVLKNVLITVIIFSLKNIPLCLPLSKRNICLPVYELYFNAQSLFSLDFVWVITVKTSVKSFKTFVTLFYRHQILKLCRLGTL